MCDTVIAPPISTASEVMLFGKNSDRQRNEAQAVELVPAANHASGAAVKCTYLTIPQVARTHALLICRPFWIWGAEMGANEHGVVIGNEGLQARTPPPQAEALLGMDLLRLALERATTAGEAVEVITSLLEQYGQGGNCGHLTPSYYNNGFMIADRAEAFILETVGREWMVERVRGANAISNCYSLNRAERVSAGLPELIRASGWSADPAPLYAQVIQNPQSQHIGHSPLRRARSIALLRAGEGRLRAADIMRILRDHGEMSPTDPPWEPQSDVRRTLCMHARGEDLGAQTTGSMVAEVRSRQAVHWVTGTAAPCTSIFKPMLLDVPLPFAEPPLTDAFDSRNLWWRHECLHRRALLGGFAKVMEDLAAERDALEASFHERIDAVLNGGTAADRRQVVAACWHEAFETERRWLARLPSVDESQPVTDYRATWLRMNRLAGLHSDLRAFAKVETRL